MNYFQVNYYQIISDQYLSVKNYQNDEYIDLPRINNNNIIIKTLVSHKRLNLNCFSYLSNNLKKTILHNYSISYS